MQARVTISLCNTSQIYGFDIDTTGFKSSCPTHALIEGYKVDNDEGVWTTLINEEAIVEDSHNFFQMKDDKDIYSQVRLTVSPGGGIARFRTYGTIIPNWFDAKKEYNLASANDGARIVRWSDTESCNKPNVLLDGGVLTAHGWLTPRSRGKDRNDFIVIQLSTPGTLNSIVIDTTGFAGNSPNQIRIEGCNTPEDDPYQDIYTTWIPLVALTEVDGDSVKTFPVVSDYIISHVRLTLIPDGGLQQIKCFGFIAEEEETRQLDFSPAKLISAASNLSNTSESSESTCVMNGETLIEKATIDDFKICNNNHLSPPPTVRKPKETLPIENHELYEKTILEELNGSTTQLLTPVTEVSNNLLHATNTECEEMNTAAIEQLNTTDTLLSPVENGTEAVAQVSPIEFVNVSETTTVTLEEIILTEDVSSEPQSIEIETNDITVTESRNTRKRKSIDSGVEETIPKKKPTRARSKTPTSTTKTSKAVKVEESEETIDISKSKRGRGRPKKQ
ncbi:unnamed protein product [Mucor hiemalis]